MRLAAGPICAVSHIISRKYGFSGLPRGFLAIMQGLSGVLAPTIRCGLADTKRTNELFPRPNRNGTLVT